MKLNCKPGDLAIVVSGENVGKLVDVLHEHPVYGHGCWTVIPHSDATASFGNAKAGEKVGCDDFKLRPIRPNDGEDETLTWAGKPQKEVA